MKKINHIISNLKGIPYHSQKCILGPAEQLQQLEFPEHLLQLL